MKKILLTTFLIFLLHSVFSQQIYQSQTGKLSLKNNLKSIQTDTVIFSESFDGNVFPPKNWTDSITNQSATWISKDVLQNSFSLIYPSNKKSAVVPYSNVKPRQNEWLISPKISTAGYASLWVSFYGGFSRSWLDSATLNCYIYSKNNPGWDTLWKAQTDTNSIAAWNWRYVKIGIFNYVNDSIRIAWQYKGIHGDLMAIDGFEIIGGAANTQTDIKSFVLAAQTAPAVIDAVKHTVNITVLNGTDLTKLTPFIQISDGATISPASDSVVAFVHNVPKEYIVTAANPLYKQSWMVTVTMANICEQADFLTFNLPNLSKVCDVDTFANIVSCEVLWKTDLTNLVPLFTMSIGAKSTPKLGDTITVTDSVAFNYVIKAQDSLVVPVKHWKLIVTKQNYLAKLDSFLMPGVPSAYISIDTIHLTITAKVQYAVNLDSIKPHIIISDGASIYPASDSVMSFSDGVAKTFTITAANGTTKSVWQVTINKSINYIYQENFDPKNYRFPPAGWTRNIIDSTTTWMGGAINSHPFDTIDKTSPKSAFCMWSTKHQDEWLISPNYFLKNQTYVDVEFYAGFSTLFLNHSTMNFYISTDSAKNWKNIWTVAQVQTTESNWDWYKIRINISAYLQTGNVQFAWQVIGSNGDLFALDNFGIFAVDPAGVQQISDNTLNCKIYPNPAQNELMIENITNSTVIITDMIGTVKMNFNCYDNNVRIDLNSFTNGFYLVKIIKDNKTKAEKLLIIK